MKIFASLKKNKKIHFILKALKHINDDEYLNLFLDRETDPLLLEFKSLGKEYDDKRFYLISEVGKGYGFFAEFHAVLSKIAFAEKFGFTPIVSWGRDFLYYDKSRMNITENAFEYFFKQPSALKFQDVLEAKFVTEAKAAQGLWMEKDLDKGMDLSEEYEEEISRVYKKYIRFTDAIDKKLSEDCGELLGNCKILGVHFRGTDFKMNYDNHPVSVKIEQEFEVIDQAIQNQGFQKIFLATDEKDAVQAFRDRYGEMVVCYEDVFRGEGNTSVAFSTSNRDNHKYRLAYEVLRDMQTLSLCSGLIAGVSQVSICARIAKRAREEKYDYLEIIDNGKNYNNRKFAKRFFRRNERNANKRRQKNQE